MIDSSLLSKFDFYKSTLTTVIRTTSIVPYPTVFSSIQSISSLLSDGIRYQMEPAIIPKNDDGYDLTLIMYCPHFQDPSSRYFDPVTDYIQSKVCSVASAYTSSFFISFSTSTGRMAISPHSSLEQYWETLPICVTQRLRLPESGVA